MKKIIKYIAVTLCVIIILGISGTAIGAYIQGGIDKYSLPDNFDSAMQQIDNTKQNDEVRIMTSNLLVHYKSWGGSDARPRAKMFFETVSTYQPDVIGVQEVSGQWFNCLMRNKGNYEMLYSFSTGALMRMTALMYNSETLTLIDKGQIAYEQGNDSRLRRAVWGIFESKNTGERFAVISTHFDCIRENEEELMHSYMEYQTKKIAEISAELKDEYNVTVFSIGDFNTKNQGKGVDPIMDAPEIYDNLCKEFTDTRLVSKEKVSGNALDSADEPTWDHIFLDGEAEINRYVIVSPEALSTMSDHYPIFADVSIK